MDLVPVGCHVEAGIDARTDFLAGDLNLAHFALQNTADGLPVVGDFADIDPLEVSLQPKP